MLQFAPTAAVGASLRQRALEATEKEQKEGECIKGSIS